MKSSHPPSYLYAPHRIYWGTFLASSIASLAAPLYLLFSPSWLTIIGPIFIGLVALQLPAALIFYRVAARTRRTLTPEATPPQTPPSGSAYGWVALATLALLGLFATTFAFPSFATQHLGWTFNPPFYGITEPFVEHYSLWLGLCSLSLTLTPFIMLTALSRTLPLVFGLRFLAPLFLLFFAPLYFLHWGLSGAVTSWILSGALLLLARHPLGIALFLASSIYIATHIAIILSSPSQDAVLSYGVELPFAPLLAVATLVALVLVAGKRVKIDGYRARASLR